MPLENLRRRAVEALKILETAKAIGTPAALKVEPVCNALLAIRDLLHCYGDDNLIVPGPADGQDLAILRVFSEELPQLIMALEIVSTRSEIIVKQRRDGNGVRDGGSAMDAG
jgi:hypothetical protein